MIKIKRIYESRTASPGDGKRLLIDRLWPRGVKKDEVVFDEWVKELSPSTELRKWFNHDPAKWQEFKERYKQELMDRTEIFEKLKHDTKHGTVTFLYAAKDTEHNNAVALKEIIS